MACMKRVVPGVLCLLRFSNILNSKSCAVEKKAMHKKKKSRNVFFTDLLLKISKAFFKCFYFCFRIGLLFFFQGDHFGFCVLDKLLIGEFPVYRIEKSYLVFDIFKQILFLSLSFD